MRGKITGVLPVHKEKGMTSHDVVARVRRIIKERRIGHTGTLDPQVTGVLPLCIGQATRIVEYVQDLPKQYEAELILGFSTDTQDLSGEVIQSVQDVHVTEAQIREVLESFIGEIDQVPPMYSAIKIDGKRLYELARAGQTVERKSRKVTIYQIEIIECKLDTTNPTITIRVTCSKGTYIRTLCEDIGKKLEIPAVMGKLVRTRTGPFDLNNCVTLQQIEDAVRDDQLAELIIETDRAIAHMPKLSVDQDDAAKALYGQKLDVANQYIPPSDQMLYRLYEEETQRFLGVFQYDREQQLISPVKVFN